MIKGSPATVATAKVRRPAAPWGAAPVGQVIDFYLFRCSGAS